MPNRFALDFSPIAATGTGMQEAATTVSNLQMQPLQAAYMKERTAAMEIQKNQAAFQLKQEQEAAAKGKEKMDITTHPMFLGLPDEQKPQVLQWFASQGYTNDKGVGERDNIKRGVAEIEDQEKLFTHFMAPVVEANKQKHLAALQEKQDLLDAGKGEDDPKVQLATKAVADTGKLYGVSLNSYEKHVETLQKRDQVRAGYREMLKKPGVREAIEANPELEALMVEGEKTGDTTKFNAALEKEMVERIKASKPKTALKTIYGPGGQTAEVEATPGYTPPKGWSLAKPQKERQGSKGAKVILQSPDGKKKKAVFKNTDEFDELVEEKGWVPYKAKDIAILGGGGAPTVIKYDSQGNRIQ
jgi:hypothetical protein